MMTSEDVMRTKGDKIRRLESLAKACAKSKDNSWKTMWYNKLIELGKQIKKQNLESRLGIAQQRIKKYRERQKDFRKILGKEISELDPDEIKVKLNQIYDWNDKK